MWISGENVISVSGTVRWANVYASGKLQQLDINTSGDKASACVK
jgi:hypothetical protein